MYQVYIRASAEDVWQALVDPDKTMQYYYGTRIEPEELKSGSPYRYTFPDGRLAADGVLVEVDAPRRLVMTFRAYWEEGLAKEAASTVTWTIDPIGDVCCLTALFEAPDEQATLMLEQARGGMAFIMSGLKTLLETGAPMQVPAMS
jgi:uncharacterized protein YndB with AHSA1/START domain